MYLHGHVHDPNVVTFNHNKLWFAVGMCHAQRGGGGHGGDDDGSGQDESWIWLCTYINQMLWSLATTNYGNQTDARAISTQP